ncbi:hypothetical protein [Orbus mooreae]|uniref:hypothetical protein n=1 Tax=Orbus mooreae TaxID=3074107 RepID=UPI00370D08A2
MNNDYDDDYEQSYETSDSIIFDEEDMIICEQIIQHVISVTKQNRDTTTIKIFTNDDFFARNYWVASFSFLDGTDQYYLYERNKKAIIQLTQAQFKLNWQKITADNIEPNLPIYDEEE